MIHPQTQLGYRKGGHLCPPFDSGNHPCFYVEGEVNCLAKKKAYLGGRLLFLFASDRGVSCPRQPHHSAPEVAMDWNQIRDYLEDDKVFLDSLALLPGTA
jgi:hypothetical protein